MYVSSRLPIQGSQTEFLSGILFQAIRLRSLKSLIHVDPNLIASKKGQTRIPVWDPRLEVFRLCMYLCIMYTYIAVSGQRETKKEELAGARFFRDEQCLLGKKSCQRMEDSLFLANSWASELQLQYDRKPDSKVAVEAKRSVDHKKLLFLWL